MKKKQNKVISTPLYIILLCGLILFSLIGCGSGSDSNTSSDNNNKNNPSEIVPNAGNDLYGLISDTNNKPIQGVVVSDGFQCVQTDAKGIYQMKRNSKAEYVYYSVPSEYKVNTHSSSDNTASFYTKLSSSVKRYDFSLTKLATGKETNFKMIVIGDPQVSARTSDPYYTTGGLKATATNITRFKDETIKDISSTISSLTEPVYGISMGDNCDTGASSLQSSVKLALGSTSMTVFSVIGNHDQINSSSKFDYSCISAYESSWGPINYSFNRGNVHFVAMNDVIFDNTEDLTSYTAGFTDEQLAWLKQDLSYVPKTSMVILCYHIPLRNSTSYKNRASALILLKEFAQYSLFCGHTHYNEVCSVNNTINTLEHIHAAACGAWWKSTLNTEGTPNGYEVYSISGNQFSNWYYKSINRPQSFQMRLSTAEQTFGGDHGYYNYSSTLSLSENTGYIVANVFNADDTWNIVAYEGTSTTPIKMTKASNAPDAYAMGYHVGVLNRNADNYSGASKHTYYYKRSDPYAVVKVVATDEFGNQYTANTFISDFTEAMHY